MRVKLLLLASLFFAACTPYRMEIRQGNMVTPDQREKLMTGMTRTQVMRLLGSPLVNDPFHVNRWDYVYRLERAGELVTQQRMILYFEGDNLKRIDDSGMPPLTAASAPAAGNDGTQP